MPLGCPLVVATGSDWVCLDFNSTYTPTGYVYTDPYGRAYTYDGRGRLQSARDLDSNVLSITPNGITSNNGGLSVPFARDAQCQEARKVNHCQA